MQTNSSLQCQICNTDSTAEDYWTMQNWLCTIWLDYHKESMKPLLTDDHRVLHIIRLSITLCYHSFFLQCQRTTTHNRSLFLPGQENRCQPQCSPFTPSSLFTSN